MEDGKLPGQCCSLHPLYIFYMYIDKFSDLTFTFQPGMAERTLHAWNQAYHTEVQTNTVFGCFEYFAAISRTLRYIQPSDYLFRVECVSSLMNTNIEKYESGKFEAGGYKWWVYFESPFQLLFSFFLSFPHLNFFLFLTFSGDCVSTQTGI